MRFKLRELLFTSKLIQRCYAAQVQKDVVITAAVRSPFMDYLKHDATVNTCQMNALTTEAVIKQAALPKEEIELYITTKNLDASINTIQSGLLSKDVTPSYYHDSLEALKAAFDNLQKTNCKSFIITGNDSIPASYFKSLQLTYLNGLNDEEVIPIRIRQKRQMIAITKDELSKGESMSDIATSFAITTAENAARLNIKPLIRLSIQSSGEYCTKLVEELLEAHALNVQDIHRWIILSEDIALSLARDLNLNPAYIKKKSIGQYYSIALALQLIHLAHSLKPKQMACIVVPIKANSLTVMLLEKCSDEMIGQLPLLTLYTKNPCPLCDELIEELESNFASEYQLEKVFIDRKENIRFLRLYRYDIPVLFLNGQFLCMHSLNSKLLKFKLEELKKEKFDRMVSK